MRGEEVERGSGGEGRGGGGGEVEGVEVGEGGLGGEVGEDLGLLVDGAVHGAVHEVQADQGTQQCEDDQVLHVKEPAGGKAAKAASEGVRRGGVEEDGHEAG